MHEHVRIAASNGIERKVAGTVAGVATDDYIESCVFQAGRDVRCLPFESLGELECDPVRIAAYGVF